MPVGTLARQSKKKNKHLRVSAQVYGTAVSNLKMYSRETLSPASNLCHINNQDGSETLNSRRTSKPNSTVNTIEKSNDQIMKTTNGGPLSPSNGNARSKKRRAPSGVNKIKLAGEKRLKQVMDQQAARIDALSTV